MPKPTKRQIVTTLSVLYLTALTSLAIYALHQTTTYSLPIPTLLSALTIALPPLAGITLETLISFQYQQRQRQQLAASSSSTSKKRTPVLNPKIFQLLIASFIIYSTILTTLSTTHIHPLSSLLCPLHSKWQSLFRSKSPRIRTIQDSLQCCGFSTTKEMAWPFPSQNQGIGADACVLRFPEREGRACFEGWRGLERKSAICLVVVALGVGVWMITLFLLLSPNSDETPWLPSTIRLPIEEDMGNGSRPAITFRDIEDQGEADSLREEVTRLNNDSNLASRVEGGRAVKTSPLIQENGV